MAAGVQLPILSEIPKLPESLDKVAVCPGGVARGSTTRHYSCVSKPFQVLAPYSARSAPRPGTDQLAVIKRGSRVVDIINGRPGCVLTASSTHCKVCFDPEDWGSWGRYMQEEDVKMEIVPLAKLQLLTCKWEGHTPPSASNAVGRRFSMHLVSQGYDTGVVQSGWEDVASLMSWSDSSNSLLPSLCNSSTQQSLLARSDRKSPSDVIPHPTPNGTAVPILICTSIKSTLQSKPERVRNNTSHGPPAKQLMRLAAPPMDLGEMLLHQFKAMASAMYNTFFGAWRMVLDVKGTGNVTFRDLVRSGREMGFTGNYVALWGALMERRGRAMSKDMQTQRAELKNFDPPAAELLTEFRNFFDERDMTLEDAWENIFDPNCMGRITRDDFYIKMQNLGWNLKKVRKLFHMLDVGAQKDLSMDELELVGLARRQVERLHVNIDDERKKKRADALMQCREHFFSYLQQNFGSIVRAWRLGLDADGDGRLRFHEFCNSCKQINYRGKLRTLWKSIDVKNNGYVYLGDLDPEAGELLDSFRAFLENTYWTLEDVFKHAFGSNTVGQHEFLNVCKNTFQWTRKPMKIFQFLDVEGTGRITIDDFDFLGMRRQLDKTNSARQKIIQRQAKDQIEAAAVLGKFKTYLTHKFGTLCRAWHKEIDPFHDGRVKFAEFCSRCRSIGFRGNLKALWLALGVSERGYLELKEIDPDAVAWLDIFSGMLRVFFDDLESAWFCLLDPDWSGQCSNEEFVHACKALGFTRGIASLYKHLDTRDAGCLEMRDLEILKLPGSKNVTKSKLLAKETCSKSRQDFEVCLTTKMQAPLVISWRMLFCTSPAKNHLEQMVNAKEFCGLCRGIGFEGNLLRLWTDLHYRQIGIGRRSSRDAACGKSEETQVKRRTFTDQPSSPSEGKKRVMRKANTGDVDDSHKVEYVSVFALPSPLVQLGSLSVKCIAPDVYAAVLSFKTYFRILLRTSCATWAAFLAECLKGPKSRLRKVEFVQAARNLDFKGSAEIVFDTCDMKQENAITEAEFEFLHFEAVDANVASDDNVTDVPSDGRRVRVSA